MKKMSERQAKKSLMRAFELYSKNPTTFLKTEYMMNEECYKNTSYISKKYGYQVFESEDLNIDAPHETMVTIIDEKKGWYCFGDN